MRHRRAGVRQPGAVGRGPDGRHGLGGTPGAAGGNGQSVKPEYFGVAGEAGAPESSATCQNNTWRKPMVEAFLGAMYIGNRHWILFISRQLY